MLLYHWFFEGVVMVLEHEPKPKYSTVEQVIADWKEQMPENWVDEMLALPEKDKKIEHIINKTGWSLPKALSNYLSLQFTSQI